jgi:hypothetical protein
MKYYIAFVLALFTAGISYADDQPVTARINGDVGQVLKLYAGMSGKELVVEPGVTNRVTHIKLDINPPVPKKEAAKMIETALRKQADVVIEPLDDKRVAVKLEKK